jgi:predicted ester cyclase
MSVEEKNKAIVSEYFEQYWAKGNVSIVDKLCSDDFLINYPNHGPRRGKEGAKKMLADFREVSIIILLYACFYMLLTDRKAIPDLTFRAYETPMIAEGDYVAARWIGGGKHTGIAFDDLAVGKLAKPNTGKQIYFSGITMFTLKNGKITHEVAEEGGLSALQQFGLVPQPNPGKEIKYDAEGNQVYPQ